MPLQYFYLLGEDPTTARQIDIDENSSFEYLHNLIGSYFAIVVPKGIGFQGANNALSTVSQVVSSKEKVSLTVVGQGVRDIPGPAGLPYVGNFFEIFPDHLGNHQRLFERYGPVIRMTNLGHTVYHSNDPEVAAVAFAESEFFTKKINDAHPLSGIKTPSAGVFLGDTDTPEWRLAHKFLLPALGPKAVRHYAPTMQKTVEKAYEVFDLLDEREESWNVYQYMLKLGSQAVAKLTLGMDLEHLSSTDAPVHDIVHNVANMLSLNKKVTSRGNWYASLPFGDPKALRDTKVRLEQLVGDRIKQATAGGVEDLPLQDAALRATDMIDYAIRATDNKGERLIIVSTMSILRV